MNSFGVACMPKVVPDALAGSRGKAACCPGVIVTSSLRGWVRRAAQEGDKLVRYLGRFAIRPEDSAKPFVSKEMRQIFAFLAGENDVGLATVYVCDDGVIPISKDVFGLCVR